MNLRITGWLRIGSKICKNLNLQITQFFCFCFVFVFSKGNYRGGNNIFRYFNLNQ